MQFLRLVSHYEGVETAKWSAFAAPTELTLASAPLRRDSLRLFVSSLVVRRHAERGDLAEARAKRERRLAGS